MKRVATTLNQCLGVSLSYIRSVRNSNLFRCRRIQSHRRTVRNHKVFGGVGSGGIAGDAGGHTLFLVIVAQVQQAALFHDHRTGVGLVSRDGHLVQHQMSAVFHNEERRHVSSADAAERAAAMNDQRFAAFYGQRWAGNGRSGDQDIGDVRVHIARPFIVKIDRRLARLTGRLRGGIFRRQRGYESAWDEGYYHAQH